MTKFTLLGELFLLKVLWGTRNGSSVALVQKPNFGNFIFKNLQKKCKDFKMNVDISADLGRI